MTVQNKGLNKEREIISGMFNRIAPDYDFLNHLLSLNIDKYWRKKMTKFLVRYAAQNSKAQLEVLDIACGTGDSSIALYKKGFMVTGADISQNMLDIAIAKSEKLEQRGKGNKNSKSSNLSGSKETPLPEYHLASAEELPFADNSFDAVTISFGIRNFNNRDNCLAEIYRVIKPGGVVTILEFAKPRNPIIRFGYNLYFNNILPTIGGLISKDKDAYKYLADSVEHFPKYDMFAKEITNVKFKEVKYNIYTFGISVLYTGKK